MPFIGTKKLLLVLVIVFSSFLKNTEPSFAEDFPKDVFIKIATETFNNRNYFIIRNGKIWVKENAINNSQRVPVRIHARAGFGSLRSRASKYSTNKAENKWNLLYKNGLPFNYKEKDFPLVEKIIGIYADGDELLAIDSQNRFFVKQTKGKGYLSDDSWHYYIGFPKEPLSYSDINVNNRAITMGRKNADVLWYEDSFGNEHHYGNMGTSTIYLLSNDGREIMFTDNGLPADFSHHICGPLRSKFIAQNLQSSAATLFTINQAGETYTKMDDFDLNGGASMFFDYTYLPYKSNLSGKDFKSCLSPFGLPVRDWEKQPAVILKGKSKLTKKITILQTGHGNPSRELRIAGTDKKGNTGYYWKKIFDKKWFFKRAQIKLNKTDFLNNIQKDHFSESWDLRYKGNIFLSHSKKYAAELIDFNLDCSPAKLVVYLDKKRIVIKLHTVDAWTFLKRSDPGLDGTDKVFLGTLEINKNDLNIVPDELNKFNLATFSFSVQSNVKNISIKSIKDPGNIEMNFILSNKIPENLKKKFQRIKNNSKLYNKVSEKMISNLELPKTIFLKDFRQFNIKKLKQSINEILHFSNSMEEILSDIKKRLIYQEKFILLYSMYEKSILFLRVDEAIPFNDKGTKLLNIYYDSEKKSYQDNKRYFDNQSERLSIRLLELNKNLLILEKKALNINHNYSGKNISSEKDNSLKYNLINFKLSNRYNDLIIYKNSKQYKFSLVLDNVDNQSELNFPIELNGRLNISNKFRENKALLLDKTFLKYFVDKKYLPVKIQINHDNIEISSDYMKNNGAKYFKIMLFRDD